MDRLPTAEIPLSLLNTLFDDSDIWTKIRSGHLKSRCRVKEPSYSWPKGTSYIVMHFKPNGKHIATTHCIRDSSGRVVHWDAKDIQLNQVRLYRL